MIDLRKKELVREFLEELSAIREINGQSLFENPYAEVTSIQRYNLEQYLLYLMEKKPKIMLVGEAPGYKGCQKTGIPFVSENELKNENNYILLGNWKRRADQQDEKENSARIFMEALRDRYTKDKMIPLVWNAWDIQWRNRRNFMNGMVVWTKAKVRFSNNLYMV